MSTAKTTANDWDERKTPWRSWLGIAATVVLALATIPAAGSAFMSDV